MFKNPFVEKIDGVSKEKVENTSKKIKEELENNGITDKHKLLKLYEQKMLQSSMLNQFNGVYGKYQNPW